MAKRRGWLRDLLDQDIFHDSSIGFNANRMITRYMLSRHANKFSFYEDNHMAHRVSGKLHVVSINTKIQYANYESVQIHKRKRKVGL